MLFSRHRKLPRLGALLFCAAVRKRYNTLDFASKIVCRRALPPLAYTPSQRGFPSELPRFLRSQYTNTV